MNKNIYQGFPLNNSLSNLDFNALNGTNISKEDRNMSAIPLRKDVEMANNNNNEFNIWFKIISNKIFLLKIFLN